MKTRETDSHLQPKSINKKFIAEAKQKADLANARDAAMSCPLDVPISSQQALPRQF
jgi:hypothetical protein